MPPTKTHNLDIYTYSFQELLDLFELSHNATENDLKRAKMIVLKTHPDKSKLPPDYFLFYKKAFDIVVAHFNEKNKITAEVPTTKQTYDNSAPDKNTYQQVHKTMKDMGSQKFSETFNELFEANMQTKIDESVNDWFKSNDPLYEFDNIASSSGLGKAMETIKTKNAALVKYTGVQNLTYNAGGKLYEHYAPDEYVSCDPFSKLKYDDLRKVHKDQTVFSVSESDYDKVKKYSSIDQLQRDRSTANLTPIDKTRAEQMLLEKETKMQNEIISQKHAADLRTLEYAEKNKNVMASFFRLTG